MAEANGIEGDPRSTRGEVHVAIRDVTIWFEVSLFGCFLLGFVNLTVEHTHAGKAGCGVRPIHLEEYLLAYSRSVTRHFGVEGCNISIAPVVFHTGRNNDRLAPAAGNAKGLACGHLDDQRVGSRFVPDTLEDDGFGRNPDAVIITLGALTRYDGASRMRSIPAI